ncbi:MAG: hypothetical protein AB9903_35360 [Vulcanimicrobiota bacterium]
MQIQGGPESAGSSAQFYRREDVKKERPDLIAQIDAVNSKISEQDVQIAEYEQKMKQMELVHSKVAEKEKLYSILWKVSAAAGTAAAVSIGVFTAAPLIVPVFVGMGAFMGTAWLASRKSHYNEGEFLTKSSAESNNFLIAISHGQKSMYEKELEGLEDLAGEIQKKVTMDEMQKMAAATDPDREHEKQVDEIDDHTLSIDGVTLRKRMNKLGFWLH